MNRPTVLALIAGLLTCAEIAPGQTLNRSDVRARDEESSGLNKELATPSCIYYDDPSTIDVLVVYTTEAKNNNASNDIHAYIQVNVDIMNLCLANSRADPRIRVAHTEELVYDDPNNNILSLYRLLNPSDGYLDNVPMLRDFYRADLVLMIGYQVNGGGTAACNGGPWWDGDSYIFTESGGAAIIASDWLPGDAIGMAHELAHVMGCGHNRDAENQGPGQPVNCRYNSYSYGYDFQGNSGSWYSTIMSYGPTRCGGTLEGDPCVLYNDTCPESNPCGHVRPCAPTEPCPPTRPRKILYYSNPDVLYDGQPTGVPAGSPNEADNVTTINNNAFTVANWRQRNSAIRDCAAWNGRPVCQAGSDQYGPIAVADGSGGAIVVWYDYRNAGSDLTNSDIFAQRLDSSGNVTWADDGAPVCAAPKGQLPVDAVPDGFGGAILIWTDYRNSYPYPTDIYTQRLGPSGASLWQADGVGVCTATDSQNLPVITADGSGGAFIAWCDRRSGGDYDVFVQHVSSSGVPLWTSNGVQLTNGANDQILGGITPDGAGGAIVAWRDGRASNLPIYARGVSASGAPLWAANGVPVCTAAGTRSTPHVIPDDRGGAIILWSDTRNGDRDIYAQRLNGSGVTQWTPNGVALCDHAGSQDEVVAVADGAGGAIGLWRDDRNGNPDVYARRLGADGVPQWMDDGIAVCTAPGDQLGATVASDGASGAYLAWEDQRNGGVSDIYCQHVNADGGLCGIWPTDGHVLCVAGGLQSQPSAASGLPGTLIVAWSDARNGSGMSDIYAQCAGQGLATGIPVNVPERPTISMRTPWPNPSRELVTIQLSSFPGSPVSVRVFDVSGRLVKRLLTATPFTTGTGTLRWDGRNESGQRSAAGVYFVQMSCREGTVTGRVVLLR